MKYVNFILWRLANIIVRILLPSFWIQNYKTNWHWDCVLLNKINSPETIYGIPDKYTVVINGKLIWISNYPYAYGSAHHVSDDLPSPITRILLKRKINELIYGVKP